MFKQQIRILDALPQLRALQQSYPSFQAEPARWLETAEQHAQDFVVPVPLIGGFSAGKSSLVNALIGRPVFSVSVDPQTASPAELRFGENESFTACFPDGKREALEPEDIRENKLDLLHGKDKDNNTGGWIEAVVNAPNLQPYAHLRLVDMPGWASGMKGHATAIDTYVDRALAYIVVVSADEGDLRGNLRDALKELQVRKMPILLVISKADKKPADEVAAVEKKVCEAMQDTLGYAPERVVRLSARKDITPMLEALAWLEGQAEALFAENVVVPFVNQLELLAHHLGSLLGREDMDSEKIAAEIAKLHADVAAFRQTLDSETQTLDGQILPVLGKIMERVKSRLNAAASSYASRLLGGGGIDAELAATVRLAVEEGMKADFAPQMERYLGVMAAQVPVQFQPQMNLNLKPSAGGASEESGGDWGTKIAAGGAVLLPALRVLLPQSLKFLGPIGMAVSVAATLFSLFGKSKGDASPPPPDPLQDALRQVLAGLDGVVQQTQEALLPVLCENVQSAKQKIAATASAQEATLQAGLQKLEADLAQGQATYQKHCEQYRADLGSVQALINALKP
jgi:GTP-binding protein EngB required for normal cell division